MAGVRVVRLPAAAPRRRRDEDAPRRHLRLVLPSRRSLRLSPRLGVVLTVVGFVALFGVAVCHALLIQNQASVDELDRRVAAEQARYEKLRLEVAELSSPQRIQSEAQNDLGMVPAGETVWLTPEQPAPTATTAPEPVESTDTSAARVKPYLEGAP
jgi:cell division protein FtsL